MQSDDLGGGPILKESDLCKAIPTLKDKFVVDLVNGVDTLHDLLRKQSRRNDRFFQRMFDGMTGQGARRQTTVGQIITEAIEDILDLQKDLTYELANANLALHRNSLALTRVNDKVGMLNSRVADGLEYLASVVRKLQHSVDALEVHVHDVRMAGDAQQHLEYVISCWTAGKYERLPVLGRCFVALEELRWGAFGAYYRTHQTDVSLLLDTAKNLMTTRLAADLDVLPNDRVDTDDWVRPVRWRDAAGAIAYLVEDYEPLPSLACISSGVVPRDEWSQDIPLRASASRLATEMVEEVFVRDHTTGG